MKILRNEAAGMLAGAAMGYFTTDTLQGALVGATVSLIFKEAHPSVKTSVLATIFFSVPFLANSFLPLPKNVQIISGALFSLPIYNKNLLSSLVIPLFATWLSPDFSNELILTITGIHLIALSLKIAQNKISPEKCDQITSSILGAYSAFKTFNGFNGEATYSVLFALRRLSAFAVSFGTILSLLGLHSFYHSEYFLSFAESANTISSNVFNWPQEKNILHGAGILASFAAQSIFCTKLGARLCGNNARQPPSYFSKLKEKKTIFLLGCSIATTASFFYLTGYKESLPLSILPLIHGFWKQYNANAQPSSSYQLNQEDLGSNGRDNLQNISFGGNSTQPTSSYRFIQENLGSNSRDDSLRSPNERRRTSRNQSPSPSQKTEIETDKIEETLLENDPSLEQFICGIGLGLAKNRPVLDPTNLMTIYERQTLKTWLETKCTSPKTKKPLFVKELIPLPKVQGYIQSRLKHPEASKNEDLEQKALDEIKFYQELGNELIAMERKIKLLKHKGLSEEILVRIVQSQLIEQMQPQPQASGPQNLGGNISSLEFTRQQMALFDRFFQFSSQGQNPFL